MNEQHAEVAARFLVLATRLGLKSDTMAIMMNRGGEPIDSVMERAKWDPSDSGRHCAVALFAPYILILQHSSNLLKVEGGFVSTSGMSLKR